MISHLYGVTREYKMIQMHFHAPSEHTIDGQLLDLEVHFVHIDVITRKPAAVIGVLFKAAEDIDGTGNNGHSHFLHEIMPDDVYDDGEHKATIYLDDFFSNIDFRQMYYYDGSFTTPPCTEGINWFVVTNVLEISKN